VGFRWFVRQAAVARGVHGDVRNLPDGAVEIRASGPEVEVARLLDDVRHGPPGARVDDVRVSPWDGGDAGTGFDIRR
jgi:acylphosphatase